SIPSGFDKPSNSADSTVGDGVVSTALETAAVTLFANNDISFDPNAAVAPTSGSHSLTLRAGNSISFGANATVTLRGSSGIFTATINDGGSDSGNRDAGNAAFTMASGSS